MGTYNSFDGSFYAGHSDDKLSLSVNGEAQKNGGIRYIDDNGNKAENKFSNFGLDLSYNPIDAIELRLNALTSNIDTWYASSLTLTQYEEDPTQKSSSFYSAVHQKFSSDVIGAGASYYLNNKLSFNDFTVGIDGFDGERKSSTNNTSKDNLAAYVIANYSFGNSRLKAGYRYEKISYKYTPTSGTILTQDDYLHGIELGYNYMLTKEMSLFANYSKSYQALTSLTL